jgi:23S rRNA pseudouridine1911/1915/1917 synthase
VIEAVPAALEGERVDRLVAMLGDVSRADAVRLLEAGAVRIDGEVVRAGKQRVHEGQVLELDDDHVLDRVAVASDPSVSVDVVHADADVIVVDKPAGLVVHPGAGNEGGTLVNGLLHVFPELAAVGDPARPGIVHRLDRGTSGLLVVARTPAAYDALVGQLSRREVGRRYAALVWGVPESSAGLVDAPVGRSPRDPTRMAVVAGGREARTRYEVRTAFDHPACVLLTCRLETGRTHQIRVHLAAIGHPVVGDATYGGARSALALDRPFLHAEQLAFDHPATGARLSFTSALPADLQAVLATLG